MRKSQLVHDIHECYASHARNETHDRDASQLRYETHLPYASHMSDESHDNNASQGKGEPHKRNAKRRHK
jgi:hypothetical protein